MNLGFATIDGYFIEIREESDGLKLRERPIGSTIPFRENFVVSLHDVQKKYNARSI